MWEGFEYSWGSYRWGLPARLHLYLVPLCLGLETLERLRAMEEGELLRLAELICVISLKPVPVNLTMKERNCAADDTEIANLRAFFFGASQGAPPIKTAGELRASFSAITSWRQVRALYMNSARYSLLWLEDG